MAKLVQVSLCKQMNWCMFGHVWSRGRILLGPKNQLLGRSQVHTSYLRDQLCGRVCRCGICLHALSLISWQVRTGSGHLCCSCLGECYFCLCSACKGTALLCVGMLGLCVYPHSCLDVGSGNHCCLALAGWDRSNLCVWGPMDFGLVSWEGLLLWIPKSPGFTFPEQVGGGAVTCMFKNILPLREGTDKLNRFTLKAYGFTRKNHHAVK